MNYPSIKIMGYRVFSGELESLCLDDGKLVINTLNAYSYVMSRSNSDFSHALHQSDVLVADGEPVVFAARVIKGVRIRKIAGNDVFHYFLKLLNKDNGSCFFLGSSDAYLIQDFSSFEKRLSAGAGCLLFSPF